jgi:hypothetical protein
MGKNKEISKKLRALQSEWRSAEPMTFSTIKDGDYVAKIVSMEIAESKNGRMQVVTTFKVADGKLKGKEVKKFDGLASAQNMGFFKGFCQVIGFEIPEDIEDLSEALMEFVSDFNSLVNIKATTRDEFQNIRVTGLSEYDADDENSSSDDDDDENSNDDGDEKSSSKNKKKSRKDEEDEDSSDSEDDEEDEPKHKSKKDKDKKRNR